MAANCGNERSFEVITERCLAYYNAPAGRKPLEIISEVMDDVKMNINFTPEVWTGRQLNEKTPSSRWVGATITGSMTRRRTNNWLKTKIKEYQATGATPELVIQGIMDDANSDYYAAHGSDVVTCVGCVLTGDLPLTALDAESGSVVDDVINFNIKNII